MNKQEHFIGDLLNDENLRAKHATSIDESLIHNQDLKNIVTFLKEGPFCFTKFYKTYGKDAVVYAMDLANKANVCQLIKSGKL